MSERKLMYFLDNRKFATRGHKSTKTGETDALQVIDGQIVLNENNGHEEEQEIITSKTYSTKKTSMVGKRWSEQESELFYQLLECTGCEFSMIQIAFPQRTRANLREKYKKELKQNKKKIESALNNFKKFDLRRFKELTNKDKIDESVAL
ncbi:hypothetical protein ENBRE01_0752 [Enteropsectra breve]|nr:hypothetical protein ENBRE01_0752 [Enteropsectra breve]